ncbi:MAG: hypothetical protein HC893_15610 [Chloroflexaceae bacterium]|nr:hypothetical protein [Chloroflexaceae bacterium]
MSWWNQIINAITTEYERRVRAASEVIEYGLPHDYHHDAHAAVQHATAPAGDVEHAPEQSDTDDSAITNVVPGDQVPTSDESENR